MVGIIVRRVSLFFFLFLILRFFELVQVNKAVIIIFYMYRQGEPISIGSGGWLVDDDCSAGVGLADQSATFGIRHFFGLAE